MFTTSFFFLPKENTTLGGPLPPTVSLSVPGPGSLLPLLLGGERSGPGNCTVRHPSSPTGGCPWWLEWRHTALVPCPTPCQPPRLCPFKGMESAGSGRGARQLPRAEPLSPVQEAWRHSGFFSKLTAGRLGLGAGRQSFFPARSQARAGRELNRRQRWRPCLLSAPSFPVQV